MVVEGSVIVVIGTCDVKTTGVPLERELDDDEPVKDDEKDWDCTKGVVVCIESGVDEGIAGEDDGIVEGVTLE